MTRLTPPVLFIAWIEAGSISFLKPSAEHFPSLFSKESPDTIRKDITSKILAI